MSAPENSAAFPCPEVYDDGSLVSQAALVTTKPVGADALIAEAREWIDKGTFKQGDGVYRAGWLQIMNRLVEALATPTPVEEPAKGASPQQETVAFVQEWMMSGDHEPTQWDRDFAAAIDARTTPANAVASVSDEQGGEASEQALAILRRIDDAYAQHMGDPEGNDDIAAAKNAAALVIDQLLQAQPNGGAKVEELREALMQAGRKLLSIEDAVPIAKDANRIILAALNGTKP